MPHTPGPWKAEILRNGGASIRAVNDPRNERGQVAALNFGKQAEIKADAALIAAAPEMRALLTRIAGETCDHGPMPFCPHFEARQLLARLGG